MPDPQKAGQSWDGCAANFSSASDLIAWKGAFVAVIVDRARFRR
ncbi:MAG: hypothetical protein WBA51_11810 [Erythrobacter sp.]